jgi:uncharacterized membrane protein
MINADTQTQLEIKLWPLLSLGWPQPEFHFMGLTVSTCGVKQFMGLTISTYGLTVSLYGVTISTYGANHTRYGVSVSPYA